MFETLSDRLSGVFGKLTRQGALTDEDIATAMREVRTALLEADVSLPVARSFVQSVTDKARTTLYTAAMKIIHRQRPLIYLYHPVNYYGVSKKVSGVVVYGDGLIRAYNAGYIG